MRRMITTEQAKVLEYVVQDGNTTKVGGNLYIDGTLEVGEGLPASAIYKHCLKVSSNGTNYEYFIFTTRDTQYELGSSYSSFIDDIGNIICCYLKGANPNGKQLYPVMIYTDGTGALGFYINESGVITSTPLPSPIASVVSDTLYRI